jgi:hypothetical protein
MMFLAHFSGWSYSDIMEMPSDELFFWAVEAEKLHREINRTE